MASSVQLGHLGQVSMLARDTARVEAFYRDSLGLPHIFTFGDLPFFDCDGTRLYVRTVVEEEWRPSSILYFVVPDVQEAYRKIAARGVTFKGAPQMIYRDDASGDEEWMAFFDDSEGNTLAIMSRVPARAGEAEQIAGAS
jgi:predicted enzyme related to lactoylglutathione lyase